MLKTTDYRKTLRASASSTLAKPVVAKPAKLSRWHAVSIVGSPGCCPAVTRLAGERWLLAQAPQLPVKGCDARACDCRYRQHDTRRGKSRRKAAASELPAERERRAAKGGRRDGD